MCIILFKDNVRIPGSITAAIKDILLLSDVADDIDNTELIYWATVEGGTDTGNDSVDDNDVTSPYWKDVEAHMGCKLKHDSFASFWTQEFADAS